VIAVSLLEIAVEKLKWSWFLGWTRLASLLVERRRFSTLSGFSSELWVEVLRKLGLF
jgi:hypothetical protein